MEEIKVNQEEIDILGMAIARVMTAELAKQAILKGKPLFDIQGLLNSKTTGIVLYGDRTINQTTNKPTRHPLESNAGHNGYRGDSF